MLTVYIIGEEGTPSAADCIYDVDTEFGRIRIPFDDADVMRKINKVAMEIDHGVFVDDITFRDRFGLNISHIDISTGLKALRVAGEPLDGYTYTDMIHNPSLGLLGYLNEGELGEVKVLMIDRYDLYRDKFEAEIEALSHRCVVLIDCKHKAPFEEYEVCKLSLQRRLIRVTM